MWRETSSIITTRHELHIIPNYCLSENTIYRFSMADRSWFYRCRIKHFGFCLVDLQFIALFFPVCPVRVSRQPPPSTTYWPICRLSIYNPIDRIDYSGPFIVKEHRCRNARTTKVYLTLFVCMSMKDVHLEIVLDLTTYVFFDVFDRFVARRRIPSNIYSDCDTNFTPT